MFGIGRNKTGTTSLQEALLDLGYRVAPTQRGEVLLPNWAQDDYKPIVALCGDFNAFQDIPFSLPGCFEVLDKAFPNSKFVLTVRDSEDQWFQSLTRFHTKVFGRGRLPTWQQLEQSEYRYIGFAAQCHRYIYDAENVGLYDADGYKRHYLEYNQAVRYHFEGRPNDLLELNVAEPGALGSLCEFLGFRSDKQDFPWANRTNTKNKVR